MADSKILSLAQAEATRTRSDTIGTEHLLLALLADGRGEAVELLRELGVNLERIRQEIEWKLPVTLSAGTQPGRLPLSPQAQHAVDSAGQESVRLLLALLEPGSGLAGEVLAKVGVRQAAVLELLDDGDR